MVARLTGGQEAAGSSPVIPRKRLCKGNFTKLFLTDSISFIILLLKAVMVFSSIILFHPAIGEDVTNIYG